MLNRESLGIPVEIWSSSDIFLIHFYASFPSIFFYLYFYFLFFFPSFPAFNIVNNVVSSTIPESPIFLLNDFPAKNSRGGVAICGNHRITKAMPNAQSGSDSRFYYFLLSPIFPTFVSDFLVILEGGRKAREGIGGKARAREKGSEEERDMK